MSGGYTGGRAWSQVFFSRIRLPPHSFLSCRGGFLAEVNDHCAIDLWLEQGELEFLVSWIQNRMNNSQDVTNTSSGTCQVNSIYSSCILPFIAGLQCSSFLAPLCLVPTKSASWWRPNPNWSYITPLHQENKKGLLLYSQPLVQPKHLKMLLPLSGTLRHCSVDPANCISSNPTCSWSWWCTR